MNAKRIVVTTLTLITPTAALAMPFNLPTMPWIVNKFFQMLLSLIS